MTTANTEKHKALEAALKQIERTYGKGSIMKMGEDNRTEVEVVSTGSLGLDIALGIGGLPKGRIIEIYGPESSGKTTLTLHAIAEAQKRGGTCAFIDAEHALDPIYARKLGVNVDSLLLSQPDTGEQGLEIADTLVRCVGHRQCGCPGAQSRIGRRDGGFPYGSPGSFDEPSLAETDLLHCPFWLYGDLHQPDPSKDWRDVWQP